MSRVIPDSHALIHVIREEIRYGQVTTVEIELAPELWTSIVDVAQRDGCAPADVIEAGIVSLVNYYQKFYLGRSGAPDCMRDFSED